MCDLIDDIQFTADARGSVDIIYHI